MLPAARPSRSLLPLPIYFAQSSAKDSQVLNHFFGSPLPHAPVALDDAIIIGLDAEWYTRGATKHVTELGIAILDPATSCAPGNPAELLKSMELFHARIMPNAHLINKKANACPDKFQFGKSKFVTVEEARQLLTHVFRRPSADGNGYRPVIFVGHALDNDIELMRESFGVDIGAFGTIAKTIDTQVMAREVGVESEKPLISLKELLKWFGIEEEYLHTAGNDVVYTMAIALVLSSYTDPQLVAALCRALEEYKEDCRNFPIETTWGTAVFCTRCNSRVHMADRCNTSVVCYLCVQDSIRARFAHTHMTEKCIAVYPETRTPSRSRSTDPCELCAKSKEFKRWNKAHTHNTADCAWAKRS